MKKLLTIFITITFLSGCASMFHGSTDKIAVQTSDPDAEIFVDNRPVGKGSAIFSHRKKDLGSTIISVRKEGCQPSQTYITGSFDATTLLGLFIDGGLISILMVDGLATGAWVKADQTNYYLNPVC